jgi:hypothetical protein
MKSGLNSEARLYGQGIFISALYIAYIDDVPELELSASG